MPTREFFKGDPEYGTRVKLTMLNHFIRPWAAKLAEWARLSGKKRIWFVDLFAGEGLLGSGILGSPLIAAKLAAERIMANESVELAIFAVEEDKNSFQELEKNAAPYRARGVTFKSRQGEWTQYLGEVVSLTDGDPVLLFVDPFGLTGVRFATLDTLLGRQTPTDLIVRLHDPAIYRNADQYPELISEGLATTSWNLGWTLNLSIEQRMHIARSAYKKSIEQRMPPNFLVPQLDATFIFAGVKEGVIR